MLSKNKLQQLM